jgi:hypothetical protein
MCSERRKTCDQFTGTQIEFFIIYTSMEKLISLEKVDLIGLDKDMGKWLMTVIDYYTDCKVSRLEVQSVGDFWSRTYKKMKNCDEITDWIKFFGNTQLKLSKMMKHKWETMFKEAVKEDMKGLRTDYMFIDQVYHGGHKYLYEALYANFSLFHQVIWTFRSMV